MLYDIPGRTGTPIEFDSLARLAAHDRIVAVKDAKGDIFEGSRVIHETGLAYYSGDDALNLAWLTHGAVGVVSVVSHVAAREYADLVAAVEAGDLATALRLHRLLLPVVRAVMTRASQGAITAKAAVHDAGIIASRAMRPPLFEATQEEVDALRRVVAASGLAS
jgi:4-hydroxy-tetrahydrodipicolinate synthase